MNIGQRMYVTILAAFLVLQTEYIHGAMTFIKSTTLDGYRCAGTLDFGTSPSARQCLAECERVSTCNSISYSALSQSCLGNFVVITHQPSCSSNPGWLYYKSVDVSLGTPCSTNSDCPLQFTECATNGTCQCRTNFETECTTECVCVPTSTYMFPCTTNAECMDDFTACWEGYCKCKPGYSYVSSSNVCVLDCVIYGNTYERYTNYDLTCTATSDFHSDISINQCLDICTGTPTCLSISYHNGLGACQARYCDPMTNNLANFMVYTEVDTYVRNCV